MYENTAQAKQRYIIFYKINMEVVIRINREAYILIYLSVRRFLSNLSLLIGYYNMYINFK